MVTSAAKRLQPDADRTSVDSSHGSSLVSFASTEGFQSGPVLNVVPLPHGKNAMDQRRRMVHSSKSQDAQFNLRDDRLPQTIARKSNARASTLSFLLETHSKLISALDAAPMAQLKKVLPAEHLINGSAKNSVPSFMEFQTMALRETAGGDECEKKSPQDVMSESLKSSFKFLKKKCPGMHQMQLVALDPCLLEKCGKVKKKKKCTNECAWVEGAQQCGPAPGPPKLPKGCTLTAMKMEEDMCYRFGDDEESCKQASECEVTPSLTHLIDDCAELPEDEELRKEILKPSSSCGLDSQKEMQRGLKMLSQLDKTRGELYSKLTAQEGACTKAAKSEKECTETPAAAALASSLSQVFGSANATLLRANISGAVPCKWFPTHPKGTQCGLNSDWLKEAGVSESLASAFDTVKHGKAECGPIKDHEACNAKNSKGCHWRASSCNFAPPKAIVEEIIAILSDVNKKCGSFGKALMTMLKGAGECASAVGKSECEKIKHCVHEENTRLQCPANTKQCPNDCKEIKEVSCEPNLPRLLCPESEYKSEAELNDAMAQSTEKHLKAYCSSGTQCDYCESESVKSAVKSAAMTMTMTMPFTLLTVALSVM